MTETKKITPETHLRVLALYTMAVHHYAELRKYEAQIGRALGTLDEYGNAGRISDSIYQEETFAQAFSGAGLEIEQAA
jgi:hypothetical protein